MSRRFRKAILALLAAGVLLQSAGVRAESFEIVSYTPPKGWLVQNLKDGTAYVRPDRNGIIRFHVDRFDSSLAALACTVKWRALVEPHFPGPAPEPQFRRAGDFSVAIGGRQEHSSDGPVALQLVTVTGRGRTVAIVGMAAGDEARREAAASLDT